MDVGEPVAGLLAVVGTMMAPVFIVTCKNLPMVTKIAKRAVHIDRNTSTPPQIAPMMVMKGSSVFM